MKRLLLAIVILVIGLPLSGLSEQNVKANDREIHVYYEGERLSFEDTDPILINDRTMVPFRKIFETLGFEIEWVAEKVQKAIGKKEGLRLELTINSNQALVNGQKIELDAPAQLHKNRTLVPLRFVAENSGYHVHFFDDDGVFKIGIGRSEQLAKKGIATSSQQAPSFEQEEPYVVKGRVVNQANEPLAGAKVLADNTMFYNSNIIGRTDEEGYYYIDLPEVSNFSYRMYASYEIEYNGQSYVFDMVSKPDEYVSAKKGAVRDFELDIHTGEVFAIAWDHQYMYPKDENAPWLEMKDVELTLKPIGKLADGTVGSIITSFLPVYSDKGLEQVPVGTYEISAVWKPQGYNEIPLHVSLRDEEEFRKSIVADFVTPVWSSGGYFQIQLDVAFPE